MRDRIITIALMLAIALFLLGSYIAHGQEVEKAEIKGYDLVEPVELSEKPEKVTMVEVPIYAMNNANIIYDAYFSLLDTTNEIIMYVEKDVKNAYDSLYFEYEETWDEKEKYRKRSKCALTVGVVSLTVNLAFIIGGLTYATLAN